MAAERTMIRAAKFSDIPALHQLLQLSFAQYRGKLDTPSGAFRETDLYFHRLAVLPGFRHRRIGGRLIAHVEKQARDAGLERVRLCVRTMLPETRFYYERTGVRVIGQHAHKGYDLPTYYVMEHDLSQPPDSRPSGALHTIEVVPHDPSWSTLYDREAAMLSEVFGHQ